MPSNHDPEALLREIEWTIIRRLDGFFQGDYRTFFRGFGLDLADLREYQPGDDVRYIDWNVTARLQTPFVREYNEDREVTAWFLLDISPSVDFGSADVRKRELLVRFVAIIARLLVRHGNRVGAVFYSGKVEQVIPARGGRTHLLHVIDSLTRSPEFTHAPATSLRNLLQSARQLIGRRSLVFLVSDFYSEPGWDRELGSLNLRNEVLAVRVFDPIERELPDIGVVFMSDSETGEQMLVDTHSRSFRQRYSEAASRHEESLRDALAVAGVDGIELSTEDDLVETLIRYATLRKRFSQSRQTAGRLS